MKAVAAFSRVKRRLIVPLLLLFTLVPALVLFFHSTNAESAFPGNNGKIVFVRNYDIYVMNADGSGATNLTNSPGFTDDSPAFSSDGTKIVYTSTVTGGVDILSMNADGSNVTQLTNDANWDAHPAWSPDGTKIVFQSDRAGGGNWEIYTIDANGANLTRLTNVVGNDSEPAWSPDGTKIAFTSYRDGNAEIYRMDTNGANQINLTNHPSAPGSPADPGIDNNPAWSPDGSKIAYSRKDSNNNEEIYWMMADGTAPTQVTYDVFSPETLPAWSPDGTKITFVSGTDASAEIFSISTPGNDQTPWVRLTSNGDQDGHPDWQPALAPVVDTEPAGANGRIIFSSNYELFGMNADGSGLTSITNTPTIGEESPDFTPDGSGIAFSCLTSNFAICGMIASGGTQVPYTSGQYDRDPSYSPDGSRIAFSSNRDGNQEIYKVDLIDAISETRLTRNSSGDYYPDFSPDGSKIVFQSIRDGSNEIYIMNEDGSVQTRLTTQPGLQSYQNYRPVFSPDGSKIVFYSGYGLGKRDIYVMNTDGSGLLNLTNSPTEDDVNPTWSPDGFRILFMKYDANASNSDIWVMNADGSGQTLLTSDRQGFVNAAWQPLPNYHWTWYDNLGGSNWVLLANPASATRSLTYGLSLGGASVDLSPFNNGVVAPGASVTPAYGSLVGGPVAVTSTTGGRGIVSQRSLWPKGGSSIEEVIGTDRGRLSSHFYWTWYDQLSPGMSNWVMVANPGPDAVTAEVSFRNQADGLMVTSPQTSIAPGQSWPFTFPGKMGGPIEVKTWRDGGSWNIEADRRSVLASQRVLSGGGSAFNEAVGVPEAELSTDYYWPWFDDIGGQNWLMMANPGVTPVTYRIDIGGGCDVDGNWNQTPNTICQSGTFNQGEILAQRLGVRNGPVHVWSLNGQKMIASQRIVFGPSFGETMGYPASALASTYHWTWYDQLTAGMQNWVMVANPSATAPIDIQVWMAGQQAQEGVGPGGPVPTTWTLQPGEKIVPRFGSYMGGPVEVRAYQTGTTTPAPGGAIVSQRILYNGYFNETLGTVIN